MTERRTTIPAFEPEVVAAAARKASRGSDEKVATTSLAELATNPFLEFAARVRARRHNKQHHFQGRAAAATVEALVFGLRERGTAALREPKVRHRIGELSEPQVHEVCARLQKLNPEITAPWPVDKIEQLVEAWVASHAR
jgi:hypothetical protein